MTRGGDRTYVLKLLSPANLSAAMTKAAHYRDLNQPEEAESICRDVLEVDPSHQVAWKLLGLALTDRFPVGPVGLLEEAIEAFGASNGRHFERLLPCGRSPGSQRSEVPP